MEKKTELFIKNLTKKIINEYDVKYPIDIDKLIYNMGGKVEIEHFLNVKKTKNGFIISTNDNNNYQKALMLGYLILHLGFKTNNNIWNKLKLEKEYCYKDFQFEQIKEFMYNILMPDELFQKELKKILKYNIIDNEGITKLAKIFEVNETLVISKLKKLYLLEGVNYEISK